MENFAYNMPSVFFPLWVRKLIVDLDGDFFVNCVCMAVCVDIHTFISTAVA